MPVRIKPVHDLGPCRLDFESIKNICALVDADFPSAKYSAEDGVWEVYEEDSKGFLTSITGHEKLDSFVIQSDSQTAPSSGTHTPQSKVIKLVFDRHQASLRFTGDVSLENWLEHFLFDLEKHILPVSISQIGFLKILARATSISTALLIGKDELYSSYCVIELQKKTPNPLWENIKANILSNIIWILFGIALAALAYFIFVNFGININEIFKIPAIPTPTITP